MQTSTSLIVRAALPADVPAIAHLIDLCAAEGAVLRRTEDDVRQHLADFMVAEHEGNAVGCAALDVLDAEFAEVRSVSVHPGARSLRVGRSVVNALIDRAADLDIATVFLITKHARFFASCGFIDVDTTDLADRVPWCTIPAAGRTLVGKHAMIRQLRPVRIEAIACAVAGCKVA